MNLIILILLTKLITLKTEVTESFEDRRAKTHSNSHSIALPPTSPCRHICYNYSMHYSSLKHRIVLENTLLECEPGSKFKRLERLRRVYRSEVTCSGVVSKGFSFVGELFTAIIDTPIGERRLSLDVVDYCRLSMFNQGSESQWSRAVLRTGLCSGDEIISSGVWVVDNPTEGCCGRVGVIQSTAVYYKVVIKGDKCSSTCYLLGSVYAFDRPLTQY